MKRKINLPSKNKSLIDNINYYPIREENYFSSGTVVSTKDGLGKVIGIKMRKNTNLGPGTRQYVIQLDDGRVRHYLINNVKEV